MIHYVTYESDTSNLGWGIHSIACLFSDIWTRLLFCYGPIYYHYSFPDFPPSRAKPVFHGEWSPLLLLKKILYSFAKLLPIATVETYNFASLQNIVT